MSQTHDLYTKLSGHEALAWINSCVETWKSSGVISTEHDSEALTATIFSCKPVGFKNPRRSRAKKSSSSERSSAEYQCHLCDARVWADGFGAQCSRKKLDGSTLCTIHNKEAAKNDGLLRNGLITEERPSHPYGDETKDLLPWYGVDVPKKEKKGKKQQTGDKKQRKCGCCGGYGHNARTCPHKSTSNTEKVDTTNQVSVPDSVEHPSDNGAGTGLVEAVVSEAIDTMVDTIISDQASDQDAPTQLGEDHSEYSTNIVDNTGDGLEGHTTELPTPVPESDGEEEEDEDSSIIFQGIKYTLDTEENTVHDDELTEIGTWDSGAGTIVFVSPQESKLHRLRVLESKQSSS